MYTRKSRLGPVEAPTRLPSVRFAIVGNPRTGSSHLVSLLDSHPDVACWDDEILDTGEAFDRSGYRHPAEFLVDRVFWVDANAVGFKLLWDAMDRTPDVWGLLERLEIRLIHCVRANRIDQYLSFQLARINQAFTSWYGDYKTTSFAVDIDDCLEWIQAAEDHDREIRDRAKENDVPRLEIEYHALCTTQDPVLDFLGAARRPLVSRLLKQRHDSQAKIIKNYDALKARFADTPWAGDFVA